jgi:hypothetical protein
MLAFQKHVSFFSFSLPAEEFEDGNIQWLSQYIINPLKTKSVCFI